MNMSATIMRALGIVLLSFFVAWFVWLVFIIPKTHKPLDKAQVNLAMRDVKIIKEALEFFWTGYNPEEEEGVYTTKSYEEFKKKITERIVEDLGGMPVGLPIGKSFSSFSYRGNKNSYHIVVEAKDRNRTVIHGTREKIWQE